MGSDYEQLGEKESKELTLLFKQAVEEKKFYKYECKKLKLQE